MSRLHKVLATHGFGSRREIESWIAAGRIVLNGKPAQIGDRFEAGDRVQLDGKDISARLKVDAKPRVLIYHKPQGQPLGEEEGGTIESVMSRLPAERGVRWIPINPMHPGDSGLLLLTNDGALSYALTRHKRGIPTAYAVRVLAGAEDGIREVPTSVAYDDETVEFTSVEEGGGEGSNVWYHVAMPRADRRAAVRALFESRQLKVSRMTQVSFASIELPRDLPRGKHREASKEQTAELYRLAELAPPQSEAVRSEQRPRKKTARRIAPDRRPSTRKRTQRR